MIELHILTNDYLARGIWLSSIGTLLIRIGDAAPGDPRETMTGETMKKYVVILAVLLIGALPLLAQDQTPRVEVFGGYSYVSVDTGPSTSRKGLNGWNGQLDLNLNRWLGLTGDFGGYYGSVGETVGDVSGNRFFHDLRFLFSATPPYQQ